MACPPRGPVEATVRPLAPHIEPAIHAITVPIEPLIDASTISARVAALGDEITRDYQGRDIVVVPVLKGSYIFAADLVRRIDLNVEVEAGHTGLVLEIEFTGFAGDTVWIPPDERHWHGAAPGTAMCHIAFQEALDGRLTAFGDRLTELAVNTAHLATDALTESRARWCRPGSRRRPGPRPFRRPR